MAERARRVSAASLVFVAVTAAVVVLAAVLAALLVMDAQRSARVEAEEVTRGVAASIAVTPAVADALRGEDASATLQPYAEGIMARAGVDFVTIMTPDGIRATHLDPAEIGRPYIGTIPVESAPLTEEFAGTPAPRCARSSRSRSTGRSSAGSRSAAPSAASRPTSFPGCRS